MLQGTYEEDKNRAKPSNRSAPILTTCKKLGSTSKKKKTPKQSAFNIPNLAVS